MLDAVTLERESGSRPREVHMLRHVPRIRASRTVCREPDRVCTQEVHDALVSVGESARERGIQLRSRVRVERRETLWRVSLNFERRRF